MLVYVVLKNADFTEGRGPMVFNKIFANQEDAKQYAFDNLNPYGNPDPIRQGFAQIVPAQVVEAYDHELVTKKKEEKKRLQDQIKELNKQLDAIGNW